MIAAIKGVVAAMRSVIDLLMLRKQEKKLDLDATKADLEIDKLRREKSKSASPLITPDQVSIDDIQRFDPRAKRVAEIAARHMPSAHYTQRRVPALLGALSMVWILVILITVGYCIYRLMRHFF